MPKLAMLLVTLVTEFVAWLAKYLSQKVAVAVTLTAVLTGLFVAVYVGMNSAISSSVAFLDGVHPMFGVGIAMVISPHASALLTSYLAFWALIELYKWKVNILSIWSKSA